MTKLSVCGRVVLAAVLVAGASAAAQTAVFDDQSLMHLEQQRLRYALTSQVGSFDASGPMLAAAPVAEFKTEPSGRKSPFKAFLLSAVVPGAGQWYYGSRIKPPVFLAVEALAWGFHLKYHGDGEDATDVYEAFNRAHWSPDAYADYLEYVYGHRDDDDITAQEVSHHLPDTETQQYFEMTGKYNQFAWGWDDATLGGLVLTDRITAGNLTAITSDATTPSSPRRTTYEGLRHDANRKYDKATKMTIVVMANHLVSALEAYFMTAARNKRMAGGGGFFSRTNLNAEMRSYGSLADTPYFTLSYKF